MWCLNGDKDTKSYFTLIIILGSLLIAAAFGIGTLTYFPVIWEEIRYALRDRTQMYVVTNKPVLNESRAKKIEPVDKTFGIVIPKIGVNAHIIKDVSTVKEPEYQRQLTKGVAHALGSPLPGEEGTTFLFAHSSQNWYEANRYNSIFYLLHRLETGDAIHIFLDKKNYMYVVTGNHVIKQTDTEVLHSAKEGKHLLLMTCWPPGTTLQRLIVTADLQSID